MGSTFFYKYHHEYLKILEKYWNKYMSSDDAININKSENKSSSKCIIDELVNSNMDRSQLFNEMSNIIGGSIDNASNVLGFILFNLGKNNPNNIQQILYDELINIHKLNNKNKSEFDYKLLRKCNKLHAFIYECMRLHIPNPLGATRFCDKNINIKYKNKKYFIPKGTIIWWNVTNTVYDKKYWDGDKYPNDNIILERFLDENNNKFIRRNELMIFGWGKRKCTGRLIVIHEFIHIIANIIYKYKIKLTNKDKKYYKHIDDVKKGIGFTECKPYGLILEKRTT